MQRFPSWRTQRRLKFETLESRLALSGAGIDVLPVIDAAALEGIVPFIMAGDPNGTPPDSPENRVDPNTTDSPFGGVGSLRIRVSDDLFFFCSAAAISPTHVLTAAHCLDGFEDDGVAEFSPEDYSFILNFGSDHSHVIVGKELFIHPDFTGFANPSVNDDLGIIELAEPIPEGVPIYPLYRRVPFGGDVIILAGYGFSGDGVNGLSVPFDFSVKRVGANVVDAGRRDDDLPRDSTYSEVYLYDFDGPDLSTNLFGGPTLGNDIETSSAPGDSGGPVFIVNPHGELALYGVTTFGFRGVAEASPLFGSGGGGMIVWAYSNWIDAVVAGDHLARPGAPGPGQDNTALPAEAVAFHSAAFTAFMELSGRERLIDPLFAWSDSRPPQEGSAQRQPIVVMNHASLSRSSPNDHDSNEGARRQRDEGLAPWLKRRDEEPLAHLGELHDDAWRETTESLSVDALFAQWDDPLERGAMSPAKPVE